MRRGRQIRQRVRDARKGERCAGSNHAAPQVFLNARTDTFWLAEGKPDMDETLRRVRAFAEAGADGVFVPGITADDDVRAVVDAVDVPLNVLFTPGRTDVA